MNEYLITRLKEARNQNGLKQSEVAKKIGVKGNTLSNYENGVSEPDIDTFCALCEIYSLDPAELLGEAYGLSVQGTDFNIKPSEIDHIKKYRSLDPYGKNTIEIILDREIGRIEQMDAASKEPAAIIDIHTHQSQDVANRFVEYFHSASAGSGVFILGNEITDQIQIPDTPENRKVDFAIAVSGDSMIPDYNDGDIVLVSQKEELNHGDVGIFIINSNAYIKEYGESELISRNPNAGNIKISEYDNIVCMGKVVGKLTD